MLESVQSRFILSIHLCMNLFSVKWREIQAAYKNTVMNDAVAKPSM